MLNRHTSACSKQHSALLGETSRQSKRKAFADISPAIVGIVVAKANLSAGERAHDVLGSFVFIEE